MTKIVGEISRRNLLLRAVQLSGLLALSGCQKIFDGLSKNSTVQTILASAERGNRKVQRLLAGKGKLAQEFAEADISPKFRSNGNPPPITMDYATDARNQWTSWWLEVGGSVQQPIRLSLVDLQAMPARTQITRHDCVEGWSAIGKWKGVPLRTVLDQVQPTAEAKYVVFHCMDSDDSGALYYESIDLIDAVHPQTLLAYELNGQPLPIENGAPLRLRVENQLGYKHAKYIRRIDLVGSFANIGQGKGGYWEDQGYEWYAGI